MTEIKRIPEFQAPVNHIVSEKAKLIKELTEKQLNKTISLQEELTRKKNFTKSNELISITTYTQGEKNLDSYKEFTKLINNFEELKSYGLTDNEVEFLNEYKKGEDIFLQNRNLSKLALEEKLKYIYNLIEKGKNKTTNEQQINLDNNKIFVHPINNLHQIHEELFGHLNKKIVVPSLKKRRKRIKKYLEVPTSDSESPTLTKINHTNNKSKWDVKEIETNCLNKELIQINKISNQSIIIKNDDEGRKNINTGKSFIGWKFENITNEFKRISVDEIRLIDRFKNYEAGIPSKVLYIKNLPKNLNEKDLVYIFGRFDNEEKRIIYRLLTGKMRGQAFITFHSINQATNALETINGYILKDKPIIIEYGKCELNNTT